MANISNLTASLFAGAIVVAVAGACQSVAGIEDRQLDLTPAGGSSGSGGGGGASGSSAGASGDARDPGDAGDAGETPLFTNCRFRRRIIIKASAAVPALYSVSLKVQHASLRKDGKSLDSGDDVRIARWTGSKWEERDRVLGLDSSWNREDTELWFKVSSNIPPAGQDTSYYVYYGDAKPPPALADANQVFVFFDDFESGSLSRWVDLGSPHWSVGTLQRRSGSRSLRAPNVKNNSDAWLVAKNVDAADVAFDAYWYMSQINGMRLEQGFRAYPNGDWYEAYLEGVSGWGIAKYEGGDWAMVLDPPSNQLPVAEKWVRITTTILGTGMNVYVNGDAGIPRTGSQDMGIVLSSGTIGFAAADVPNGQEWWVDDVRVRKLVHPEPKLELGPEEVAPFGDP